MTGDEGQEVQRQQVARIGGAEGARAAGLTSGKTVPIVKTAHAGFGDQGVRAEGVAYDSNNVGVDVDTSPYPAGTRMTDSTPSDNIN